MPRVQRQRKARSGWDEHHRRQLLTGHMLICGSGFGRAGLSTYPLDVELMESAWLELRRSLLPAWIDERPFSRPYGWWEFDAPERRRCINADHPFDEVWFCRELETIARDHPSACRLDRLSFGRPAFALYLGGDYRNGGYAFESESDYLQRLDLLNSYEKRLAASGLTEVSDG